MSATDTSIRNPGTKPGGYIETTLKSRSYRYYGWAHVVGATCVGQGDWRQIVNGKERRVNGIFVPGDVLSATVTALKREGL